jgi:formylglycine-generating enzyme required for sulfatase activity
MLRAGSADYAALDLHPGVGEWTQDRHRGSYGRGPASLSELLQQPATIDPDSYRVVRGCSSLDLPVFCRRTARGYQRAGNAPAHVGFRCMLPTPAG